MNILDNISYRGTVDISVKKSNGVVRRIKSHNSGTSVLFNVIAKMLSTDSTFDRAKNIPAVVDVRSGGSSVLVHQPVITASSVSGGTVTYVATIDFFDFNGNQTGTTTGTLQLRNKNNKDLASIDLDETEWDAFASLTAGTQIIVNWALTFSNESVGTEE